MSMAAVLAASAACDGDPGPVVYTSSASTDLDATMPVTALVMTARKDGAPVAGADLAILDRQTGLHALEPVAPGQYAAVLNELPISFDLRVEGEAFSLGGSRAFTATASVSPAGVSVTWEPPTGLTGEDESVTVEIERTTQAGPGAACEGADGATATDATGVALAPCAFDESGVYRLFVVRRLHQHPGDSVHYDFVFDDAHHDTRRTLIVQI